MQAIDPASAYATFSQDPSHVLHIYVNAASKVRQLSQHTHCKIHATAMHRLPSRQLHAPFCCMSVQLQLSSLDVITGFDKRKLL